MLRPILVAAALVLAACSNSGDRQVPVVPTMPGPNADISPAARSLIFAYPYPGQVDVVPGAPVVLRFSHPVAPASGQSLNSLFSLTALADNSAVPFTAKLVDEGRGVVITPNAPLAERQTFKVSGDVIPLSTGPVSLQPPGQPALTFTTRAAFEGPSSLQSLSPTFQVSQMLPAPTSFLIGSQAFDPVDFSSLRLLMTQPVDALTATYGSTIRLEQDGTLVPARLLVDGRHVTIDPEQDLTPGLLYILRLTNGLRSQLGNALVPGTYAGYSFVPQDSGMASGKASRIQVNVPQPAAGASCVSSVLLGTCINQVPVASPLLGQGDNAPRPQAGGSLFADLALPANFARFSPSITPLRVPRGNVLKAGNLAVKLDGKVPANLNTGDLGITLISDANGLLLPNRFSTSLQAPALVTLEMDIAVSAQNNTSNGAFTQNISHVQVAGYATVDQATQRLSIDAVGAIELKVLGVDNATGVLALRLETDLARAPDPAVPDATAPSVQSWVPGDSINGLSGGEFLRPGDPVIVNFSEAMDAASLRTAGVTLRKGGAPEPFNARLDGVSLVVTPVQPWQHGVSYTLDIGSGLKDVAGNAVTGPGSFTFTIPGLAASRIRPPIVLSVSPGYPCPIEVGTRNVAGGLQGRCAGGNANDDLLPLPVVQPNDTLSVVFSQSVAADSIRQATACNGVGSLRVERVDAAGNCVASIPGRLIRRPRDLAFVPDQPWVKDQLYRYVLQSNNNLTSSAADCTGSQAICGSNGLPLQTQLIARTLAEASNPQRGGPPLEVFFRGGSRDPNAGSTVSLRVLPVQDVNANFRLDAAERNAQSASYNPVSGAVMPLGGACVAGIACLASNGALLQPNRFDATVADPDYGNLRENGSYSGAATRFRLGCDGGVGAEDEVLRPNGVEASRADKACQNSQFLLISSALSATLKQAVPLPGNAAVQAIEVNINPSLVVTSGAMIFADLGVTPDASPVSTALFNVLGAIPVVGPLVNQAVSTGVGLIDGLLPIRVSDSTNTELPEGQVNTGPLVLRMRYPRGNGPIKGYIFNVDDGAGGQKLVLQADLDLYLDIPELNATATVLGAGLIPIEHDARSNMNLSAPRNNADPRDVRDTSPLNGSGTARVRGDVKFLPDGRLTVQLSNIAPVRLTVPLSALNGLLGGALKVRVPKGRFIIDASLAPLKPAQ